MARTYKRDRKGQFARTGTGSVRSASKKTTKRKATTKKTTVKAAPKKVHRRRKPTPPKAAPRKKTAPRKKVQKGTITSQQYKEREANRLATKAKKQARNKGNIKHRSGKSATDLARLTGLKRSTVMKLQKEWKTQGVPKGLARRVNDPSYRRSQNAAAMKRGKGKARRKKK